MDRVLYEMYKKKPLLCEHSFERILNGSAILLLLLFRLTADSTAAAAVRYYVTDSGLLGQRKYLFFFTKFILKTLSSGLACFSGSHLSDLLKLIMTAQKKEEILIAIKRTIV